MAPQNTFGILLIKVVLILYNSQRDGLPGRRVGKQFAFLQIRNTGYVPVKWYLIWAFVYFGLNVAPHLLLASLESS